jgi:phasin family protein
MTLPDKFAEASKQQLASHIDFFQTLTSRMFENAQRILDLNLQTTRAALDQTTGVARQLAAARDPRDLLALRAQSQQQVDAVLAYSRKLFEIANKPVAAPEPAAAAPVPEAKIDTAPPVVVAVPAVEPAPASAPAPAPASEPEAAAVPVAAAPELAPEPVAVAETGPAPVIAASEHPLGEADPVPAPAIKARAKPIAKAAGEVAAASLDTPHPAASPMPESGPIIIPPIAPVDAVAAPVEAGTPPAPKRTGKGSKKR